MSLVAVAGASGALGRHVLSRLKADGHAVRALSRAERPDADGVTWVRADATRDDLAPLVDGASAVISALGAPISFTPLPWAGFDAIDRRANLRLLDAAVAAGVRRFVYVSTFGGDALPSTVYVAAHEAVVDALRAAPIEAVILRPTGFFTAYGVFLSLARWPVVPIVGSGAAVTNPIHEADVAAACVEALDGPPREVALGGPETHTRRAIVHAAAAALGRRPWIVSVPPALARTQARLLGLVHPRLGALIRFLVEVSVTDLVAPAYGTRALDAWLSAQASPRRRHGAPR